MKTAFFKNLTNLKNFNKIIIFFIATIILFIIYFLYNDLYNENKRTIKCNQTFALCPAAECTPDPLKSNNVYCPCKVSTGANYSYGNKTCDEISPYTGDNGEKYIYSTFSPIIASLGYEQVSCPSKGVNLNCMNKLCTVNPNNPKEAICVCNSTNNNGESWFSWQKKNTKSSCNYVSGGSLTQHHSIKGILDKQQTQT